MSDVKPNVEEILNRLSDVLDVLKRITEDLHDISKSLKTMIPASSMPTSSQPSAPTITPTLAPEPTVPKTTGKGVEDIKMMFPEDLEALLTFEDKGDFIMVTPRQYLGSENFAKIASAVREAGGEYVSAGRSSHFRVPK